MSDSLYPEISVVCSACGESLRVNAGTHVHDVLWLHERRCDQRATVCPSCDAVVKVSPGLDAHEALWLHGDECTDAVSAFGFAS